MIYMLLLLLSLHYYCCTNAFLRANYAVHRMTSSFKMSTLSSVPNNPSISVNSGKTVVLRGEGLTKSYSEIAQFQDISLQVVQNQCIGLIGPNGAGKSTLLRCIGGLEPFDSGKVDIVSNYNRVVYVEQEISVSIEKPVLALDIVFSSTTFSEKTSEENKRMVTIKEYLRFEHESKQSPGKEDDDRMVELTMQMSELDCWEIMQHGFDLLEEVGLSTEYLYKMINTLSGGERKKISLIAAILKSPDILLMDEPTNHLDIDALEWLAKFMQSSISSGAMTIVLVTHDRYFLEQVCNEIMELESAVLHRYPGNYERYLELKAERLAAEDAETSRARTKLRTEKEWMAKQPRARQAKSKARQDQYYKLVDLSQGREAATAMKLRSPETGENGNENSRLGGLVAEFRKASYSWPGRVLLKDFTYDFNRGDRIGIVGPNGVGKSTYLQVLAGLLPLSSGTVRVGETVRIGYYSQNGLNLTQAQEQLTVMDYVLESLRRVESTSSDKGGVKDEAPRIVVGEAEAMGRRKRLAGKEAAVQLSFVENSGGSSRVAFTENEARKWLNNFQFPPKKWKDRLYQLSGGERRRLQLLQVIAAKPNLLLLDEPTNDLDLKTLLVLEDYLMDSFEGCLAVISHDRYFLNKVTQHLFLFEGDGVVRDFLGSYDDYLEYRRENPVPAFSSVSKLDSSIALSEEEPAKNKKATSTATAVSANGSSLKKKDPSPTISNAITEPKSSVEGESVGLSYSERKEYNKLEKEISKLLEKVEEKERALLAASNKGEGYSILTGITREINDIKEEIREKEERWINLAERA